MSKGMISTKTLSSIFDGAFLRKQSTTRSKKAPSQMFDRVCGYGYDVYVVQRYKLNNF